MYIGCPIIIETALYTDRERDLSSNHGITRIPQSITNTMSHQWILYVQMWPRYSWLLKMCWGTPSEMTYTVYRWNNDMGDFQQVTRNHSNTVNHSLWFLAASPPEDSIMRTPVWEGFGAVQCCTDVPQNLTPALGTMATGLHCQQWPLFWKGNSCNFDDSE